MHSILESEGVPTDPYEVLCHMGALIIEGRTPLHISKGTGECSASGETATKSVKPYSEGPHCPTFTKHYSKDSHNVHKCSEKNVLCIRNSNLKQHLLHLHGKSVPIMIEVSLGPDCLCGELRSQSTLVFPTPCKRDVLLEQWVVTFINKKSHEPSQMSLMNLYQALRSLLHFSQLTAWYMNNKGMKPAHVIYRVGVPGDSTFVSDDEFVKHDFPVADINKTTAIKVSVKTLPRMEKIPTVQCPQHPDAGVEEAEAAHSETKEKKLHSPEPMLKEGRRKEEEEVEEKLPLKFQGARKKILQAHERKRKKRIPLFPSSSALVLSETDILDGVIETDALEKKRTSQKVDLYKYDYSYLGSSKKRYQSDALGECSLMKNQNGLKLSGNFNPELDLIVGLQNLCDKARADFRKLEKSDGYKKTSTSILDDRMQISCPISGKHHCNSECDEEVDRVNNEKPKRRRSLSKVRGDEGATCQGKYKAGKTVAVKSVLSPLFATKCCSLTALTAPQQPLPPPLQPADGSKFLSMLPETKQTPITDCLPLDESSSELESFSESESSKSEEEEAVVVDTANSNAENDDSVVASEMEEIPETSNPFLEAILRTTKRSENKCDNKLNSNNNVNNNHCNNNNNNGNHNNNIISNCIINNNNIDYNYYNNSSNKEAVETSDSCDQLDKNLEKSDIFLQKLKNPIKSYITEKVSDLKAKVEIPERVQSFRGDEIGFRCGSHISRRSRLDLRLGKKSPAVRDLSDLGDDAYTFGPSEFISKSINRLKCLFEKTDLKAEPEEKCSENDLSSDICSNNNHNHPKVIPVPSAQDKLKFRRSLDSAAQLVFHRCSGLPLTSSPAPVRRNNNSFSFDSSLNSVSAIKSALFEPSNSVSSEDENESEGSLRSPASPGAWSIASKPINYHCLSPLPLLGTFEESVLNGRLEPVSTVHGFTAELGASGSFCPRHSHLPVTVFFYTLGDNDKVSAPYLGHINLGKKGYNVPRSGTIQVTLFNPLRTVVKMFVVVYDLHDMPVNSHTFLRQRTLYMPANQKESIYVDKKDSPFEQEDYHKYLRYLIHLRFVSGKTGKIYLHTDIRMIIFRKADVDTATAFGNQIDGETFELRSHTHGPINPKFSPRK